MLSLLEDLLLLKSGAASLVRNIDIEKELTTVAQQISLEWIEAAERGISQVESGMRRNLLRSLAIDAFATGLPRP
jgi:DNA polymerase-3 subunit delta'